MKTHSRLLPAVVLLAAVAPVALAQTFTPVTSGPVVTELGAWRSVNWVDYDRDGDLDLFVTRGKAGGQDNVLFRNDGPPFYTFTRMSSLVISQDHEPSDGSSWGDYDNDGNVDCFVANWYNRDNLLYRSDGGGGFSRITSGPVVTSGGYSETGSWGDYNNDGLLDLYVANSAGTRKNMLFKNLGNGQFSRILTGPIVNDAENTRGVSWIDYDEDGDVDLFAANENGENNALYRNLLRETGVDTFARVSGDPLVTSVASSWSATWGDYDGDGDLDVFITHQNGENDALFQNNGNGTFTAVTSVPPVSDGGFSASAVWADMDNDGDLDLTVTDAYSGVGQPNRLYKNLLRETGTATFLRVTTGPIVTDLGYTYGLSWGDYDEDGDLDLAVARTFNENQTNTFYLNGGNGNHWVTIDCRGTLSNGSAIGAKIRVKATINGTAVWQYQVVEGQNGYCSQNLQIHVGLGDAASIDSLRIDWPSGLREVWTGIAVNRRFTVVERDSTPVRQLQPANRSVNVLPSLLLQWTRSSYPPPYRLQLSADSTFSSILLDTLISPDTLLLLTREQNHQTFFWRIQSARSIHQSVWSEVWSWSNEVVPPSPPLRLLPSDHGANVPLTPRLRWMKTVGAQRYRVRLSTDSLQTALVADTLFADTSYQTAPLNYLSTYYWTVQAENFAGASTPAAAWTFTSVIQAPEVPALLSPAEGDSNQPSLPLLSWSSSARADSYRVRVSTDTAMTPPLLFDATVAETTAWFSGAGSLETCFWSVQGTNAGGSSPFSPVRRFTTRLAAPLLIGPANGSTEQTAVTLRWRSVEQASRYSVQLSRDSTFALVEIEGSALIDTVFSAAGLQPYANYYWRARAAHPQSVSDWTAAARFATTLLAYTYTASSRWNLVSVPATVATLDVPSLFPSGPSPFYSFKSAGGYALATTFHYGAGYWVRLAPGEQISIIGAPRLTDTVAVEQGWNLVGSLSTPVAVHTIGSLPPGIVTSKFYGYNGSYQPADSLRPMHGYWVKALQPGMLLLHAAGGGPSLAGRIFIREEKELPPPAPEQERVPEAYSLAQNYPNPFNPSTIMEFSVPRTTHVSLTVLNTLGQEVALLVNDVRLPGVYRVEWDASRMAAGTYFSCLRTSEFTGTRKLLLIK